jgi:hypothetical protein
MKPAILALFGIILTLSALATQGISRAVGAELTPVERKFVARLSAGVIVGGKMLLPPDPNLVELDALAETGPEDLRPAAALDLISWAMARRLSTSAESAWKAAEADGQMGLYQKWIERAALHFDTNYRKHFPFPLDEFIVGGARSANFVKDMQMTQRSRTRLKAVAGELRSKTCLELKKAFEQRGQAAGLRDVDPRADSTMLMEISEAQSGSLMANLTSRASKPLTNVIVISHATMTPFEPKVPEAAKMLRGLNDFAGSLVKGQGANSDVYQDNVLLDQWFMGRDTVSMVFMPTLAPRQKISIPVCPSDSGECALRCSVAIYCDEFMIREMPVLGLVAWQRKDVASRLRRGSTAFDDGKPRIVADNAYEQTFQRARSAAKK